MLARFVVNGNNFSRDAGSNFQSLFGGEAPAVDGNDGDGLRSMLGGLYRGRTGNGDRDGVIMAANHVEKYDEHGNEDDSDPCAFREFRQQNDDHGDAGDKSTEAVDADAFP